ncbi:MAG: diguanylate cyclase [Candidatus Methylomirabilales bacterium]
MDLEFLLPPRAMADVNTKAYTPVAFSHLLERETRRAVRYQDAFAIIYVALDRNPQAGDQPVGETELAIVAENIWQEIRGTDLIGRRGQMFSVLLLYVNERDTEKVAERVRGRIQNYAFPGGTRDAQIRRTVSIGGVCFPLHARDSSLLKEQGLSCLRRAQTQGGNRVLLFDGTRSEEGDR